MDTQPRWERKFREKTAVWPGMSMEEVIGFIKETLQADRAHLAEEIEKFPGFISPADKDYQTGFNVCREKVLSLLR